MILFTSDHTDPTARSRRAIAHLRAKIAACEDAIRVIEMETKNEREMMSEQKSVIAWPLSARGCYLRDADDNAIGHAYGGGHASIVADELVAAANRGHEAEAVIADLQEQINQLNMQLVGSLPTPREVDQAQRLKNQAEYIGELQKNLARVDSLTATNDTDPRISEVESLLHQMHTVVELYGDGEPVIEYDRDYRKAVPLAKVMASLRELAKSTKATATPKVSVWLTQAEWASVQEKRKAGE